MSFWYMLITRALTVLFFFHQFAVSFFEVRMHSFSNYSDRSISRLTTFAWNIAATRPTGKLERHNINICGIPMRTETIPGRTNRER